MTSITFYTRQRCPLCEDALDILEPIARKRGQKVHVVDIDLDLTLLEKYNDRVPVIVIGDSVVAEGAITKADLKRAIPR